MTKTVYTFYTFVDKDKNQHKKLLSKSELTEYLKENKDLNCIELQKIEGKSPALIRGTGKNDEGFKESMQRIQAAHPLANLSRWT